MRAHRRDTRRDARRRDQLRRLPCAGKLQHHAEQLVRGIAVFHAGTLPDPHQDLTLTRRIVERLRGIALFDVGDLVNQ